MPATVSVGSVGDDVKRLQRVLARTPGSAQQLTLEGASQLTNGLL